MGKRVFPVSLKFPQYPERTPRSLFESAVERENTFSVLRFSISPSIPSHHGFFPVNVKGYLPKLVLDEVHVFAEHGFYETTAPGVRRSRVFPEAPLFPARACSAVKINKPYASCGLCLALAGSPGEQDQHGGRGRGPGVFV